MDTIKTLLKERLNSYQESLPEDQSSPEEQIQQDPETNLKQKVKYYSDPNQAHSEALAARLFEYLGVPTLNPQTVNTEAGMGVASDHIEGLLPVDPSTRLDSGQKKQLGAAFNAAVLTGQSDLAGPFFSGLGINPVTKNLHVLNLGATFNHDGDGNKKVYDEYIDDHNRLRDPEQSLFTHALLMGQFPYSREILRDTHKPLSEEDHQNIKKIFMDSGHPNAQNLHRAFVLRAARLNNHYKENESGDEKVQ